MQMSEYGHTLGCLRVPCTNVRGAPQGHGGADDVFLYTSLETRPFLSYSEHYHVNIHSIQIFSRARTLCPPPRDGTLCSLRDSGGGWGGGLDEGNSLLGGPRSLSSSKAARQRFFGGAGRGSAFPWDAVTGRRLPRAREEEEGAWGSSLW